MEKHLQLEKMVWAAHNAGLQVIPCKPGTKEAAIKWKKYHDEHQYRNTDSDVKMWLDAGYSTFLVLTGTTSQNLEVLDFDVLSNGTNIFAEFMSTAVASIVKDCPVVTSGKGGKHLWYYSENESTKGLKLAYQQDGDKEQVVIETRANKQYIVLPFSVHPNGTYYLIDDDAEDFINSIPTIEANDLEMVYTVARTFNTIEPKVIDRVPRVEWGSKQYPNDSTINRFNKETSIEDILEKYGYSFAAQVDEKEINYYRPGKTEGSSSVSVHLDTNTSWHYSENDEMSGRNKQITPFDIYCHYEHGDNTGKAVYAISQTYNKEKYEMHSDILDKNGKPTGFKNPGISSIPYSNNVAKNQPQGDDRDDGPARRQRRFGLHVHAQHAAQAASRFRRAGRGRRTGERARRGRTEGRRVPGPQPGGQADHGGPRRGAGADDDAVPGRSSERLRDHNRALGSRDHADHPGRRRTALHALCDDAVSQQSALLRASNRPQGLRHPSERDRHLSAARHPDGAGLLRLDERRLNLRQDLALRPRGNRGQPRRLLGRPGQPELWQRADLRAEVGGGQGSAAE